MIVVPTRRRLKVNTPVPFTVAVAGLTSLGSVEEESRICVAPGTTFQNWSVTFTVTLKGVPTAWFEGDASDELKAKVEDLLAKRVAARAAKDWPAADAIRGELDALGVVVMDGPSGATWRMKD